MFNFTGQHYEMKSDYICSPNMLLYLSACKYYGLYYLIQDVPKYHNISEIIHQLFI